jgi:urea transport system substrate-binding protein
MKKTFIISTALFLVILAAAALTYFFAHSNPFRKKPTIKVGVLHSLTGTMAISERPVVDATLLAIEEINKIGLHEYYSYKEL